MLVMAVITTTISFLILITVGVACYKFIYQKKIVEHYYTPLDHVFGQAQIEHHEEKIEKKEMDEDETDDKE